MNIASASLSPRQRARMHEQGAGRVLVMKRERERKTFTAFVSAPVVSEANNRQHWSKKYGRAKAQKMEVARAFGFQLQGRGKPKRVLLVLLTANPLDESDNLPRALKAYQDQIAAMCGFNDRENVWRHRQELLRSFEARGVWVKIEH